METTVSTGKASMNYTYFPNRVYQLVWACYRDSLFLCKLGFIIIQLHAHDM